MKVASSLQNTFVPLFLMILIGSSLGNAFPQIAFVLGVVFITTYFILIHRSGILKVIVASLKRITTNPIFILGLLTILSFGVSSWNGINPEFNMSKWKSVVGMACGGLIWFAGLQTLTKNHLMKIPSQALYMCAIVLTILVIQIIALYGLEIVFHKNDFFQFLQKISTAIAIVLPLAYVRLFKEDRTADWVIIFLSMTAVFMCGGRSGIVAFVVPTILFAYFFPWGLVKNWTRTLIKFIATNVAATFAGFVGYYLLVGRETFVQRMDSPRAYTGSGRTDIWSFSIEQFTAHPFFGIGVQGFRYLDFEQIKLSSTFHPHNIIVQLIIETGIIGTLLLAAFVLLILFKTIRPTHRKIMSDYHEFRPLIAACFFSITTWVVAAQFLTSFFHGWWLVIPTVLFPMLGALVICYRKSQEAEYTTRTLKTFPVKVSVIMPCHNGETFLKEAIDSVVMQTETDFELLIINDGSSDASQRMIDEYAASDRRIKSLCHETARGAGAARNTGLENARGRYIAFLDCDDRWTADKLATQLAIMDKKQAAFSTSYYDVIDETGLIIGQVSPSDRVFTFGRLLKCNDIGCSAAVIDTSLIDKSYFPDYARAQDFVFWCRILAQGHLCLCIHKSLGAYRVHSKSRTLNKVETAKNRIRLLHQAIGVPIFVIPYYVALYVMYGILKQLRSGYLSSKSTV